MAEKPCNLLKNGGGMSKYIDYSQPQNMWTPQTTITSAGLTYTAPQDGYISIGVRLGSYTDAVCRVNGILIGSVYSGDTTEITVGTDAPTWCLVSMARVKKGDVITLLCTFGVNCWLGFARFFPEEI
jgi:hypothetical protein